MQGSCRKKDAVSNEGTEGQKRQSHIYGEMEFGWFHDLLTDLDALCTIGRAGCERVFSSENMMVGSSLYQLKYLRFTDRMAPLSRTAISSDLHR